MIKLPLRHNKYKNNCNYNSNNNKEYIKSVYYVTYNFDKHDINSKTNILTIKHYLDRKLSIYNNCCTIKNKYNVDIIDDFIEVESTKECLTLMYTGSDLKYLEGKCFNITFYIG